MDIPQLSNNIDINKKSTRLSDSILLFIIYASGIFSVLILAGIIGYVIYRGLGVIDWQFLSTVRSSAKGTFGILGNIINTLYILIITLAISTPIGIGAAIYLNEYAKKGKLVRFIEFATETLAGIPSIIYGLFGMVFFGVTLNLKFSILCGSLTLSIMILPIIIRTVQETLKTVPESYRQGALGLGATKWYIIRTIVLPSCLSGIVTAIILAAGRIIGESAALIFTAGSGYFLPSNVFSHIMRTGGTLTIGLYLEMSDGNLDNAFGIALVLIVVILMINMLTNLLTRKLMKG